MQIIPFDIKIKSMRYNSKKDLFETKVTLLKYA